MSEQLAEAVPVNDEEVVKENLTTETAENDQNEGETKQDDPVESADEEVVITLGEDSPPADEEENQAQDSGLLNKLRKQLRQEKRERKRVEQELLEKTQPKEAKPEVGPKPKLEDFDYDDEKYSDALLSWKERSDKAKAEADKIKQAEIEAEQRFQNRISSYHEAKTKLKGIDLEEAEGIVQETLSTKQLGILFAAAKQPAHFIYAISKHTAKLKELAAISDPVEYAATIGAWETQLKVIPKKSPPPPETTVSKGSGRISGAVDSTLEKLREKAKLTKDWTEILNYNRAKAAKQK